MGVGPVQYKGKMKIMTALFASIAREEMRREKLLENDSVHGLFTVLINIIRI